MASKNTPQNPTSPQKATDSKQGAGSRPNPARFNTYDVLPDQTGFRIPNCDFIFEFDAYGGWFDEYDNYYNADGQPSTPPEYEDEESYGYDEGYDALAREYEMYDDDGDDEHLTHYDNIYLNVENKRVLQNYLKDQEINIEIKSMNYNTTESEFENFLKSKKIEWIEFEFEYDNRDRFRGICYITLDKPNAEKLIEFNGSRVGGRDIKINVLKPEEDEEHDAHIGGDLAAVTQATQKEEQKTQWRAPVEKPEEKTEQTTASTSTGQSQAKPNPAPEQTNQQPKTSGIERSQIQSQGKTPQQQGQNYQGQGNQGYGQRPNYQGNKGQNQYQKQGQGQGQGQSGGFQRNYGNQGQNQQGQGQRNTGYGGQKNQYQGQGQGQGQYQQNQYQGQGQYQQYQQGQHYQGQRNMGYSGQQYGYPYQQQTQMQGNYSQQYNYGGPVGNYSGQGNFQPQYGGYGGPQGQYPQQYQQYQNPQYQQSQPQNYQSPKPSGTEQPSVQGNAQVEGVQPQNPVDDTTQGAWGKPLSKKKKD